MLDDLILHESTRTALSALAARPPQSLLLTGPAGVGKRTAAEAWARGIIDHETSLRVIEADAQHTIAIETIRELYRATRDRQTSRHVVIIDGADGMSLEAENAFLKLLEEPAAKLTFVLTAPYAEMLLPTIRSRTQQIELPPLADDVIRRAVMAKQPGIANSDLAQIAFLAQGRPGVALSLLHDTKRLDAERERMQLVKQLATAAPYQRFAAINTLAADRDGCIATVEALARITQLQLSAAHTKTQLQHWLAVADALEAALQSITSNGNLRAQLLRLFSSM